jgi:restriction system protein
MARRKRTSMADDLLVLVAMLPWWAGLLLALVSYFVLHHMVRRTAKRGANAGGEFWGCTVYPTCRGTRPIN